MTSLVEVTVPAGVDPGQSVEFEFNGSILYAQVPEGVCEGLVFQVEVGEAAGEPAPIAGELAAQAALEQRFQQYVDERASSGDLMDRFVLWFERENMEEQFEAFIQANASEMHGSDGVEGEQDHAWWPLYQVKHAPALDTWNVFIAR